MPIRYCLNRYYMAYWDHIFDNKFDNVLVPLLCTKSGYWRNVFPSRFKRRPRRAPMQLTNDQRDMYKYFRDNFDTETIKDQLREFGLDSSGRKAVVARRLAMAWTCSSK